MNKITDMGSVNSLLKSLFNWPLMFPNCLLLCPMQAEMCIQKKFEVCEDTNRHWRNQTIHTYYYYILSESEFNLFSCGCAIISSLRVTADSFIQSRS